jgi:hypothetical protein
MMTAASNPNGPTIGIIIGAGARHKLYSYVAMTKFTKPQLMNSSMLASIIDLKS